jgi:beta-barrel assembly-enhancing protease
MNRRLFVGGCGACALTAAAGIAPPAWGQGQEPWRPPARFTRPEASTDEGGLWAHMDREETRLRRSPFVLRDEALNKYITGIACKLAGDHCQDVRVYLVNTPYFSASMAPNGMMQVWSGLLLRMENEAQLAAVIAHEIGHYLQRHSVERLRDASTRAAFVQVLGAFGLVGALGALAVTTSGLAYGRDREREADSISVSLMGDAGYDVSQAARVWDNLLLERNARPRDASADGYSLFSTHPSSQERSATLAALGKSRTGGTTNADVWQARVKPFRAQWLQDEVRRGQHEESIVLLSRMMVADARQPDLLTARGEVYRLRAGKEDGDSALVDYQAAISVGGEPPEAHRGMGMLYRARGQKQEAQAAFARYLDVAPAAPDAAMIKSYMGGGET